LFKEYDLIKGEKLFGNVFSSKQPKNYLEI